MIEAFCSCFYFWKGAPSNCPRHMLLPHTPLPPPASSGGECPPFLHLSSPSPFFIKGPGVAAANQRAASILAVNSTQRSFASCQPNPGKFAEVEGAENAIRV
ncbi:Calcyphosin [Manis pentadactyla]|nr:Calcyphosin [Manis pentadactyla]